MLVITVPAREQWDEKNNAFIQTSEQKLTLEHSLVSISKWESKWHKPFLSKEPKTFEETIDYIKCMTLTQNVNPNVYFNLTDNNIRSISEYINDSMTATWFASDKNAPKNREIVTSEVIYYWMIALNIPFECQKWHLNRLLTLVRVCNEKNKPPKKVGRSAQLRSNAALNAARRASLGTKG